MDLLLFLIGGALLGGVLAVRAGEQAQFRTRLVAYDLQFPYGLKPDALVQFLVGLTGLAPAHRRRWPAPRGVVLETVATASGIGHRLLVPEAQAGTVLAALRAHLPGVRVAELDAVPSVSASVAAQAGFEPRGPAAGRSCPDGRDERAAGGTAAARAG